MKINKNDLEEHICVWKEYKIIEYIDSIRKYVLIILKTVQ